jgi:general secretion pathway protein E
LRSILRQDPDVIMIGEIRDLETAQIAVQASLTATSCWRRCTPTTRRRPTRLTDMGVEPYLLASSLLGVLAQRLRASSVRSARKSASTRTAASVWHPVGCDKCGHSGYTGRRGVYELLVVDDAIRNADPSQRGRRGDLSTGRAQGMRTLRDDASAGSRRRTSRSRKCCA